MTEQTEQLIKDSLIEDYHDLKLAEKLAKDARIAMEYTLYELAKHVLKEEGTNRVHERLQIVTGYTYKYSDEILTDLLDSKEIVGSALVNTFKVDKKLLNEMEIHDKEQWYKYMSACETVPKKPAFKLK